MDIAAPFKPEVLRSFISIIVPGLVAVLPFTLLLGHYVPSVELFWEKQTGTFGMLVGAAVLAAGFIFADVGEQIERVLDKRMGRRRPELQQDWRDYLKLRLNDELIAHRFLRMKVTQFKFELAMPPAIVVFWIGITWLHLVKPIWSLSGFVLFSLAVLAGAAYLLWEAKNTADLLAELRRYILEAIEREHGPKGIVPVK